MLRPMPLRLATALLGPAVAIGDRLNVAAKLLLVGVVLLVPTLVIVPGYVAAAARQRSNASAELDGVRYINAILPLLADVDRDLAAVAAGGAAPIRLDDVLAAADAEQRRDAARLGTVAAWQQARQFVTNLPAASAGTPDDLQGAVAAYDDAIGALDTVIADAADSSRLVLDEQLDSASLADTWVRQLPAIDEAAATAVAVAGMQAIGTGPADAVERLAFAESSLAASSAALATDERVATTHSAEATRIRAAFASEQQLSQATAKLASDVHGLVGGSPVALNADAVFTATREASAALGPELARLLYRRVAAERSTEARALGAAGVALLLAAWLFFGVLVGFRRSVRAVLGRVDAVARGDFTTARSVRARDEVGRMDAALTAAGESVAAALRGVAATADRLRVIAAQLSAATTTIADAADATLGRADAVATATTGIDAATDTIASGIEEMGASITQIASSASEASTVTDSAIAALARADASITELGGASAQISDVVALITSIARQTNMLALNATIEASRAGASGQAFAIVAREVKELAVATATATNEITHRIEDIQACTRRTVEAAGQVGAAVLEVHGFQTLVAGAVTEQVATAAEMARHGAATADATRQIAHAMDAVSAAARETAECVLHARSATGELANASRELDTLVGQFRA
jgi:methyl-accepting chemotaxis protein